MVGGHEVGRAQLEVGHMTNDGIVFVSEGTHAVRISEQWKFRNLGFLPAIETNIIAVASPVLLNNWLQLSYN